MFIKIPIILYSISQIRWICNTRKADFPTNPRNFSAFTAKRQKNDIVNIALHISLKNFEQQYNGINIHEAQQSGYLFHCVSRRLACLIRVISAALLCRRHSSYRRAYPAVIPIAHVVAPDHCFQLFCRVIRTSSAAAVKQLVLHSCNQPTNAFSAGVVMTSASGAVHEKQRIDSAAFHRISCSCVGSLPSVALFCCIFSFGTFFGIIRVYTVVFSDPEYHVRPGESDSGWQTSSGSLIQYALASLMGNSDVLRCVSRFWW